MYLPIETEIHVFLSIDKEAGGKDITKDMDIT